MAEASENTPLLLGATGGASSLSGMDPIASSSAPGGNNFVFSPGGQSLSYSYGRSMGMGAQRTRGGALQTARGTGRKVTPVIKDANDPLHGVRKKMPYENLVKELENNPDAEIRRISEAPKLDAKCEAQRAQRLRLKYYNSCRTYARQREQEAEERLRQELEAHGVYEATIYEESEIDNAASRVEDFLAYPDHLLTPQFFVLSIPLTKPLARGEKQSSFITILSIWNTMMGTSLLSVPWALSQSGIIMGLAIAFGMSMIAAYTSSIILKTHHKASQASFIPEFAQMCGKLMGRFWEYLGSFFSLLAVTGAAVVYWVLMSNFLYNTVTFIYDRSTGNSHMPGNSSHNGVYCPNNPDSKDDLPELLGNVTVPGPGDFDYYWTVQTVPCFLLILLPLISLRSITFFTKFNSLGTVTVIFLIGVVIYYASVWGININLDDVTSPEYVPMYKSTFCSLSGMLALGLFIHNAIITIVSNNRYPENNCRDTYIAFGLVSGTYMFIGVLFYITFPLPKSCIEDNFLNNFHLDDTLTVICRALILFQLITVFPLIMYILRNQAFLLLIGRQQEKMVHITGVNMIVITICIVFATYYPSIGTIIRFSGALCGFVIIFLLPCLLHMTYQRKEGTLTNFSIAVHSFFILLGFANVVAQFVFV